MPLTIAAYEKTHEGAVARMNDRLKDGGSTWGFYPSHIPYWLPKPEGGDQTTWQEYYVVADDDEVRAAYCLKPQLFRAHGKDVWMGTWQGPVSEALVNNAYAMTGVMCLRDLVERQPFLFGWGVSERLRELLDAFGWTTCSTPFQLRVRHPARFLRQATILRSSEKRAKLLDLAAGTGLGALGVAAAQTVNRRPIPAAVATQVNAFGDWSDRIWDAAKDHLGVAAARDATTLNAQMAHENWPNATIWRVEKGGDTIGWCATRRTEMTNDRRFGTMVVGSVIDALALPGQEASVLKAAYRALSKSNPDVVITHMTHQTWRAALRRVGFLEFNNRRLLSLSPELQQHESCSGPDFLDKWHLTPIDADGPHGL